jgi:nitroreductase
MLLDLVTATRSCRRFHENIAVSRETVRSLVNLARLSASAANRQPLKYILSHTPARNDQIFPCLGWAAYLPDWPGPVPGERPAAYIIILGDRRISTDFGCDLGLAAQNLLLGAREQGLGGCLIGSLQHERLRQVLNLPPRYDILLVLALGAPLETIVLEEVGPDGDIRYWRDAQGVHHVPKRRLDDIILPD